MDIHEISLRNYAATKRRGLITDETSFDEFVDKLREEVNELDDSLIYRGKMIDFDAAELADIALVCFAMAEHYGFDLVKVMEEKMKFNELRP